MTVEVRKRDLSRSAKIPGRDTLIPEDSIEPREQMTAEVRKRDLFPLFRVPVAAGINPSSPPLLFGLDGFLECPHVLSEALLAALGIFF